MLVRRPNAAPATLIHQEQHALISGVLAAAWKPALDPRLVAAITLHDNPWRAADRTITRDSAGNPVDFIGIPIEERLVFYASGIDELEDVDPYIAYMVSLHYGGFAGMRKLDDFRISEEQRRERLAPYIGHHLSGVTEDLKWLQFLDLVSLHICLSGPDVAPDVLPVWLREPNTWSTAPDGTQLKWRWTSPDTLEVTPWPFARRSLQLVVTGLIDESTGPRRTIREIVLTPRPS